MAIKWTKDEEQKLIRLIEQGSTTAEIVTALGRPEGGVTSKAYTLDKVYGHRLRQNDNPDVVVRTLRRVRAVHGGSNGHTPDLAASRLSEDFGVLLGLAVGLEEAIHSLTDVVGQLRDRLSALEDRLSALEETNRPASEPPAQPPPPPDPVTELRKRYGV